MIGFIVVCLLAGVLGLSLISKKKESPDPEKLAGELSYEESMEGSQSSESILRLFFNMLLVWGITIAVFLIVGNGDIS